MAIIFTLFIVLIMILSTQLGYILGMIHSEKKQKAILLEDIKKIQEINKKLQQITNKFNEQSNEVHRV